MQRKSGAIGKGLGKTTGWTHRISLAKRRVNMINDVDYQRIDDEGLHMLVAGEPKTLTVDTIILCADQLPVNNLHEQLLAQQQPVEIIGGAHKAAEPDAKSAIDQASRLAAVI